MKAYLKVIYSWDKNGRGELKRDTGRMESKILFKLINVWSEDDRKY